MSARAVLLTALATGIHGLVSVQLLVMASYMTPNQDLAFVVAGMYNVMILCLPSVRVQV